MASLLPRLGASLPLLGTSALLALAGCRQSPIAAAHAAGTTAATPAIFVDRAAESGLRFHWGHAGKSPLNILDTARGGAGFIDYDGDGRRDIVLVGNHAALFHNESGGRFRDVTDRSGITVRGQLMGCAVGDYDNDGRPDLFISGCGVARLYHNRGGSGRFDDATDRAGVGAHGPSDWASSAGFADLDGDGFLDLVVGHYVLFTPTSRQLCDYPGASGAGRVWAACPPLYYPSEGLRVYRNRRDGRFEDVSQRMPSGHGNNLGLGFADYDGDGRMDFYVANDAQPGDLYHNLGNWRFENAGALSGTGYNQDGKEQAGMGVDWADYDRGGRLDLLVTTFQNEPKSLYHNNGDGLFSYASYAAGIGDQTRTRLAFGGGFLDYDNDGWPDILLANGHVQDTIYRIHPPATYAQTMQLFHNRRDGTFEEATPRGGEPFQRSIVGRAVAFGDFDDDGRVDALVADLEGGPLLIQNESPGGNHWLGVRLISRYGDRDALGAQVIVRTADGRQVGESQTCRSYLSSCDPRIHFGLGARDTVDEVIVRWPGGGSTRLSHVAADRYLTVREGAGT